MAYLAFTDFIDALDPALRAAYPGVGEDEWVFFRNENGAAWVLAKHRFSCNRREDGRNAIVGRSDETNIPIRQIVPVDVPLTADGVTKAVQYASFLDRDRFVAPERPQE